MLGTSKNQSAFRAHKRPEVLAPAGNAAMMKAAVENGADAVYFGLEEFNARLRADNFSAKDLPATMQWLHERGVKGYITLNILIFQDELDEALELLRVCSAAGVDAVLIQDLGLAYLAKKLVPDLPVHASTQMTLTCAESILGAEALGLSLERVVTARELSRKELARMCSNIDKEIEVFVHGALCVAYSGQCLTSEALGGRSANRGECAQACRLPYDLIVDGVERDLGDVKYLLSPKDLAAYSDIAELMQSGIACFKIEGRLKTPEYVAATVQAYRFAVDSAWDAQEAQSPPALPGPLLRGLEATFSRGFTGGYVHEIDHQTVVEGRFPTKRGTYLGEVVALEKDRIVISAQGPVKPGDGVVFDTGRPDTNEQGGRVFELYRGKSRLDKFDPDAGSALHTKIGLSFERNKLDFNRIPPGTKVWKTSDPKIDAALRASYSEEKIQYRRPIRAALHAHTGQYCRLTLTDWDGYSVTVEDDQILPRADKHPLTHEAASAQLNRLGDTPFSLSELSADIEGSPMLALSKLNQLRRKACAELIETRRAIGTARSLPACGIGEVRSSVSAPQQTKFSVPEKYELSLLCRTLEQVEAATALNPSRIYTDFEDIRLHQQARKLIIGNVQFVPATLRIIKPGEAATVRKLLQCEPDAVLVRNLASWNTLRETDPDLALIGDYSLNVANDITAALLLSKGFALLTPSYDLNAEQLTALLKASAAENFELTLHQYMPMFHMEHCVFCRFLSSGTDSSNCGRPCEEHSVSLRDRKGIDHLLKADFACRNTVFNGVAQSGVEYLERFRASGVKRYRIDLLAESTAEVEEIVSLYRGVFEAKLQAKDLWQRLRVNSKLGVTRGTLDSEHSAPAQKLYGLGRKPAHGRLVAAPD